MQIDHLADWVSALSNFVLAVVALFLQPLRDRFYAPSLDVSITTAPPDCVAVPLTRPVSMGAEFVANAVYTRLRVSNTGRTAAKQVEVYARRLWRNRKDGRWEEVSGFPPTNLGWTNLGIAQLSQIPATSERYCDLGHMIDPAKRWQIGHEQPAEPWATDDATCFAFDITVKPNHLGHIVPLGTYRLELSIVAENAKAIRRFVEVSFDGKWDKAEEIMFRDHLGVVVLGDREPPSPVA